MDRKKAKKIFEGYLKNSLNQKDKDLLNSWYNDFDKSEANVPGLENPEQENLLKQELLSKIKAQPLNIRYKAKSSAWFKVAASIIILVLIGLAVQQYLSPKYNIQNSVIFKEYKTSGTEIKKILLPDGSVITLNANTIIKVPVNFGKLKRDFVLQEGEAFFKIARDTTKPFVISTKALKIQVLGTSFNVNAYSKNKNIKVLVKTGKVSVSNAGKLLKYLTPNQEIAFNRTTKTYETSTLAENEFTNWIAGKTVLKDADFDELSQVIMNVYGVKILCKNANKAKYRYNIIIRSDKTLDQTLKLICSINNNEFRRADDGITIH